MLIHLSYLFIYDEQVQLLNALNATVTIIKDVKRMLYHRISPLIVH